MFTVICYLLTGTWNANDNTPLPGSFSLTFGERAVDYPQSDKRKILPQLPGIKYHGRHDRRKSLDIYDFLGKKIFSQNNLQPQSSYELDLTSYPDGVYFLCFASGLKTTTIRSIKR